MASPASNSGDIFDVRKIRRLVELMNDHDLGEIDLREGDVRIRLRKRQERVFASATPVMAQSSVEPVNRAPAAPPPAPVAAEEHIAFVRSIMVGTFFAAPSPDAATFVKVGDHVGPDTTICIIEAMKVFNEIPAGISGRIVQVLVENGDPVEYDQPLFKVDTRG